MENLNTLLHSGPRTYNHVVNFSTPASWGSYTLFEKMGRGGMATVYRGEYRGPHGFTSPVAIKVSNSTTQTQEMLSREAHILSDIHHPNVIRIIDKGRHLGEVFYVMDLIEGWNLKEIIALSGRMPQRACIQIALQITAALQTLHDCPSGEKGSAIVHSDIKPSNIMLTRDGWARLLDFGIASRGTETEPPYSYVTAAYVAPEQFIQRKVDARTDLFSLGLVLFEMVTGQRLFRDRDIHALIQQPTQYGQDTTKEKLRLKLKLCHPALAVIIEKCIQEVPSARYQTAHELEADLNSAFQAVRHQPSLQTVLQRLSSTKLAEPN